MKKKLAAVAALAIGLLAVDSFLQVADARRGGGGGGGGGGGRSFAAARGGGGGYAGGRAAVGPRVAYGPRAAYGPRVAYRSQSYRRHRYGRGGIVVLPAVGFYATGSNCAWLYWRAQETGSPYWWRRYRACQGYGY